MAMAVAVATQPRILKAFSFMRQASWSAMSLPPGGSALIRIGAQGKNARE